MSHANTRTSRFAHARSDKRRRRWRTFAVLTVVLAVVAGAAYVGLAAVREAAGAFGSTFGDGLDNALGGGRGSTHEPLTENLGPVTPELDYSGFDAADIISDEEFYDAGSLDQADIASFIETWNDGCVAGTDGTPCLADYTESTPTHEPDQYCPGGFAGAPDDTAASIIAKAAQGCGISPKVLLVLMQKEQSLLTSSGADLSEDRYQIAMGYGCPDDGTCDSRYFGFTRQVYFAARQFRMYEGDSHSYTIHPGQASDIAHNPRPDCGSAEVTVANQATANLYNYTPYQPNEAALSSSGDDCSAWGNLNFYALYQAWFGQDG